MSRPALTRSAAAQTAARWFIGHRHPDAHSGAALCWTVSSRDAAGTLTSRILISRDTTSEPIIAAILTDGGTPVEVTPSGCCDL